MPVGDCKAWRGCPIVAGGSSPAAHSNTTADATQAPSLVPRIRADGDCLSEEDGSVIVRDDLDALLQVP